ncbi:hypothetical protein BAE44_0011639 [Dichanthelium oligosanthes]|uniref:Uncharacterized protein n=1 Tax=Dichanthelium oligosanthes TaxID=888268 RepID=A0A1E5VQH8_9POAL|nr:hypothetical protein BAE44_0011639 [Dichanthelium oligosanthes]
MAEFAPYTTTATCIDALVSKGFLPSKEWDCGTTKVERRKWVNPAVAALKQLKNAGLTAVGLLWTFFERRVQPLKARTCPMFEYAGPADPTRESGMELTPVEVKARVRLVLKKSPNIKADLNVHEAAPCPSAQPSSRPSGFHQNYSGKSLRPPAPDRRQSFPRLVNESRHSHLLQRLGSPCAQQCQAPKKSS